MIDPYAVLSVARTATDAEIKIAYRKLAMELHPDKNPDNAEALARFQEINAAYDTLKDPAKKMAYDQTSDGSQGWAFNQGHGGFAFTGGDFGNMDELLRAFQQRQYHTPKNRNYNTTCVISLQDAFGGCEVVLKVAQPLDREIRVKVPAGVDNGTRIRVAGAGEHVYPDQPPGDLFVMIQLMNDHRFSRNGKTLFSEVYVDAIDAMLGNVIKVPTIDGDDVEISPSPGFQSGYKIRVSKRGMPIIGSSDRGDHVVTVVITLPADLTDEQKAKLLEVKQLSI